MSEPKLPVEVSIIWMHGLGADASDMAGLANELMLSDIAIRHIFMNAPIRPVTLNSGMSMPAWYDIVGVKLTDREDKKGIENSHQLIQTLIDEQIATGLKPEQIYLAGFSQGGAMALYTGLQQVKLGGIIALSAYLPLSSEIKASLTKDTPFFIAGGLFDPIVSPAWTKLSVNWLEASSFSALSVHQYPMEHSVCQQELVDLANWLKLHIAGRLK